MKISVFLLVLLAGVANAENKFDVSIDQFSGVRLAKSFDSHKLGASVGFHNSESNSDSGLEVELTDYSFGLFYRYQYPIDKKLRHFLEISYDIRNSDLKNRMENESASYIDHKVEDLSIFYGLEYFLSNNFSVSGRAGLGYTLTTQDNNGLNAKAYDLFRQSLSISYYW